MTLVSASRLRRSRCRAPRAKVRSGILFVDIYIKGLDPAKQQRVEDALSPSTTGTLCLIGTWSVASRPSRFARCEDHARNANTSCVSFSVFSRARVCGRCACVSVSKSKTAVEKLKIRSTRRKSIIEFRSGPFRIRSWTLARRPIQKLSPEKSIGAALFRSPRQGGSERLRRGHMREIARACFGS